MNKLRLVLSILLNAAMAAIASAQTAPPNIVLIISDDHGWREYGFMGHPHVATPRLDRLASQSR